jgi:hypothetical protein
VEPCLPAHKRRTRPTREGDRVRAAGGRPPCLPKVRGAQTLMYGTSNVNVGEYVQECLYVTMRGSGGMNACHDSGSTAIPTPVKTIRGVGARSEREPRRRTTKGIPPTHERHP